MDGGSAYHIDTDDVRKRKPALLFPGIGCVLFLKAFSVCRQNGRRR